MRDWLLSHSFLISLPLTWLHMAYLTISAMKNLGGKPVPARYIKLILGLIWPFTIGWWFVREKGEKRIRISRYIWVWVTSPWFWGLLYAWITNKRVWLVVVWAVMAFLVVCIKTRGHAGIDEVVTELPQWRELFLPAVFWPFTINRWFLCEKDEVILRYSRMVWMLLTTGWLWDIIRKHIDSTVVCVLVIWLVMSFLTFCCEAMPNKFLSRKKLPETADLDQIKKALKRSWKDWGKLILRSICWFYTIPKWLLFGPDRVVMEYGAVYVWIPLIIGWLFGAYHDNVVRLLQL